MKLEDFSFVESIADLNDDHKANDYPAIKMSDINRLIDIIYDMDSDIQIVWNFVKQFFDSIDKDFIRERLNRELENLDLEV